MRCKKMLREPRANPDPLIAVIGNPAVPLEQSVQALPCRSGAPAWPPRQSATRFHPAPGSKAVIDRATRSVSGPRSLSQTSPWWLTMKVWMPDMP